MPEALKKVYKNHIDECDLLNTSDKKVTAFNEILQTKAIKNIKQSTLAKILDHFNELASKIKKLEAGNTFVGVSDSIKLA